MEERNNSFDLIRHFAAYLVLFSHHFRLSGFDEPLFGVWNTYGFIAVTIFFSISGYFMPQSFARSDNFIDFMKKRCKRIFPGLIVCSFFMVYIIGLYFTETSKLSYILSYDSFIFFLRNSIFIQGVIPNIFSDFIFKDIINGSLWTLPIEFTCYIIIGCALSYLFSWKSVSVLLWVACIFTASINHNHLSYTFFAVPINSLAEFGIAFFTGSVLSLTKNSWLKYRKPIMAICVFLIFTLMGRPEIVIIGTICISIITIIIGISTKEKIIDGKFDISYGVYIYAFPIQQIVINKLEVNFWIGMLIATVATTIMAYFSYAFVEKPFLKSRIKKIRKDI